MKFSKFSLSSFFLSSFPILATAQNPTKILIVSRNGPSQFWTNNNNGTFTYDSNLPGTINAQSVAVGDFNGDGEDDIVLGAYHGEPKLVWNDGTETTLPGGIGYWNVKAADMNGDGHVDILLNLDIGDANGMKLLINDGTGTFATIEDAVTNPPYFASNVRHNDICLFDFNGDGKLDAIETYHGNSGGPVLLHLNDGSGKLVYQSTISTANLKSLNCELADMNGDGLMDVVVGGYGSNNVAFINNGDLSFAVRNIGGSKAHVALADVDNDGDIDMISQTNYGAYPHIWRNTGNDASGYPILSQDANSLLSPNGSTGGIKQFGVLDLNGDGWLDIIAITVQTGTDMEAYALMNDGDSGPGQYSTINVIPNSNAYANTAFAYVGITPVAPTLNNIQSQVAALAIGICSIDLDGTATITCPFDSTDGATTKAEILIGDCASDNSNFNRPAAGNTFTDAQVTATVDFTSEITEADKNGGSFAKKFCARVDVFANDGTADASVGAAKYEVTANLTYDRSGTFDVASIQTATFTAASADATATREETITARRCNPDGSEMVDTSTAVSIGSTISICVESNDIDVSVAVASLVLKDSNGETLATPVADSIPNFVTSVSAFGTNGKSQIISTLMIPSIFDAAPPGDTISASGSADISYSRRRALKASSRDLQMESAEFNVEFDLAEKDTPAIAKEQAESGANYARNGVLGVMIGFVIMAFF